MTHPIPRLRLRRAFLATVAAAVLAAAALLAVQPPKASAAYGVCGPGDFCLYHGLFRDGGLYHFADSDSNLHNDHFEGANTNLIVGDNTGSAWNNGYRGTYQDVIVYVDVGPHGTGHCILRGDYGTLPPEWWDKISAYKWATHAQCLHAGIIDLAPTG